jgi:hypothetical protein
MKPTPENQPTVPGDQAELTAKPSQPASAWPQPQAAKVELTPRIGGEQARSPAPLPADALQAEDRVSRDRTESDSMADFEPDSQLGNEGDADEWSNLPTAHVRQSTSHSTQMPPSAIVEQEAGCLCGSRCGETTPVSPPPDIEPPAAKDVEGDRSGAEADALLARLLGS